MRNAYHSLIRSLLAWQIKGYAKQRQEITDNIKAAKSTYAEIERKEAVARRKHRGMA